MKRIELNELDKTYYCYLGYESIIYPYKGRLLKYFRDKELEDHIENIFKRTHNLDWYSSVRGKTIDENTLKNKEKKVNIIPHLKCLKDDIKIYDSVYKDGIFKGYTMENSYYKRLTSDEKLKNKIEILKMIKNKMLFLNACGVYIGDFNMKNFLLNYAKNDVKLCDLDNFRIFNLDFDNRNNATKEFERRCNKKEFVDSYCFNVFTICYLGNISQSEFNIRDCYFPRILKTKENEKIIESMYHLDNSYQKKYLIDNLR